MWKNTAKKDGRKSENKQALHKSDGKARQSIKVTILDISTERQIYITGT